MERVTSKNELGVIKDRMKPLTCKGFRVFVVVEYCSGNRKSGDSSDRLPTKPIVLGILAMDILPESVSGSLDLTGLTIDRFTVLRRDKDPRRVYSVTDRWVCRCNCEIGTILSIQESDLLSGNFDVCRCAEKLEEAKRQKLEKHLEPKIDLEREARLNKVIVGDSAEIELTKGLVTIVDAEDYHFLANWKWMALKGSYTFYAVRTMWLGGKGFGVRMHRFLLEHHGCNIEGSVIDHRDGNGLNNRKSNLRICTNAENVAAQLNYAPGRPEKTSKYRGVGWKKIETNGAPRLVSGLTASQKQFTAGTLKTKSTPQLDTTNYQNIILENLDIKTKSRKIWQNNIKNIALFNRGVF